MEFMKALGMVPGGGSDDGYEPPHFGTLNAAGTRYTIEKPEMWAVGIMVELTSVLLAGKPVEPVMQAYLDGARALLACDLHGALAALERVHVGKTEASKLPDVPHFGASVWGEARTLFALSELLRWGDHASEGEQSVEDAIAQAMGDEAPGD